MASAVIHTVKQDGTGDFTMIQEAVVFAAPGDTVLVHPGTYLENIVIEKHLSLVSLYEFSGDDAYVHSAILDGNRESSVIRLQGTEDNWIDVYICGFTIQHGIGYNQYTSSLNGGGINSEFVNLNLKNNIITKNQVIASGGGIAIANTIAYLSGNLIKSNNAAINGGGLAMTYSSIIFAGNNLNSIFLNNAGAGSDISKTSTCPPIHVIVDTFTVAEPDFYFIYAFDNTGYQPNQVTHSIQVGKIEQVEHDIYVSADGSDENSGLSYAEPLQTIHLALAKIKTDSLHPRTIYIKDGHYSPDMNNQMFPLHLKSYVTIQGESRENTILDADEKAGLVFSRDLLENGFLTNDFTIANLKLKKSKDFPIIFILKNQNVSLKMIEIVDCETTIFQGIYSWMTNISLMDFYIHDNKATSMVSIISGRPKSEVINFQIERITPNNNVEAAKGMNITNNMYGLDQLDFTLNIINTQITDIFNPSSEDPSVSSGIHIREYATVNLINSTITGNSGYVGGAVSVAYGSTLNVYNSILYGNAPRQIMLDGRYQPNQLTVDYSLVEGGYWNLGLLGNNTIDWGLNNLDTNPLFLGEGDYPFALSANSPAINAGTLNLPEGVTLPETDLAGNPRIVGSSIDMGAYEYQGDSYQEPTLLKPPEQSAIKNYPNPFRISNLERNVSTTIELELAQSGQVKLEIFNAKGQKVTTLLDAFLSTGKYEAIWNGRDSKNQRIASGIYFCKMERNGEVELVKKMTVVK
jgi:hypothetical protein